MSEGVARVGFIAAMVSAAEVLVFAVSLLPGLWGINPIDISFLASFFLAPTFVARRMRSFSACVLIGLLVGSLLTGCSARNGVSDGSDLPYRDGITYSYEVRSEAGDKLGVATFSVTDADFAGRDARKYTNHTDVPGVMKEDSTVYADATTLEPIRHETKLQVGQGDTVYEITANYGDDEIKIDATTATGPQSLTRPRPNQVYDNDQLPMLVRTLPLKEDYRTDVTVFVPRTGIHASVTIGVVDRENISVPAGEFEAWKVELAVQSGTQSALKYAWYAVDGDRPLVKYDDNRTVLVLVQAGE